MYWKMLWKFLRNYTILWMYRRYRVFPQEKFKKGFTKSCKICKKTIDNFSYAKYNDLVMQLGISKKFQKSLKGVHLL